MYAIELNNHKVYFPYKTKAFYSVKYDRKEAW